MRFVGSRSLRLAILALRNSSPGAGGSTLGKGYLCLVLLSCRTISRIRVEGRARSGCNSFCYSFTRSVSGDRLKRMVGLNILGWLSITIMDTLLFTDQPNIEIYVDLAIRDVVSVLDRMSNNIDDTLDWQKKRLEAKTFDEDLRQSLAQLIVVLPELPQI